MNNAKLFRLDEVAEIIDSLHQTPVYVEEGLSMIRVTDIKGGPINLERTFKVTRQVYDEFTKKYQPKRGDILMTRVGSYGTCSYVNTDEKFCLGQNTIVIKPKVNSEFLYYCLIASNVKGQIESFVTGSTQKTISLKNIRSLEIPIPSSDEALLNIARTLSNIDEKIVLNNKIKTELKAMAKLIYDYWFVQFDFPDVNGKPYKSSGGKMVYNETLKRKIPERWEVKELSDVVAIKAGGDKPKIFSAETSKNCTIPIYSNGINNYGLYGYTDFAKITSPSLTISARGTIGVSFLRMKPFVPIIRLIVITPNNQNYLKYLDEYLATCDFEYSGSVQRQLTAPQVARMKIICPTDELLAKYAAMVFPGTSEIEILKEQNNELTKLRDWLLPMLMNGQVTVKGA